MAFFFFLFFFFLQTKNEREGTISLSIFFRLDRMPVFLSSRGVVAMMASSKDGPKHTAAAASAASPPRIIHRRRVEFPSSKQEGVTLVGELVWPADRNSSPTSTSTSSPPTTTPLPVAILQHGLADDRDGFVLPRIAEALAQRASCASLRFDFRGERRVRRGVPLRQRGDGGRRRRRGRRLVPLGREEQ